MPYLECLGHQEAIAALGIVFLGIVKDKVQVMPEVLGESVPI